MEKVPFSPAGFKQLETQLYALDDTALRAEALAVLGDYIGWVDDHVVLNSAQVDYLRSLDEIFIASLAANAAIAFVNRLPLNLVLPYDYEVLDDENKGRGKWLVDASTIAPSSAPEEPVAATGELVYSIEYEVED